MLKELIEELRLRKNKLRVWYLRTFTNRVRTILVKDPESGKEIKATTISEEEHVCQHKEIRQVFGTFWRCQKCPDIFFEISYKVAVTQTDLIEFMEEMAKELGVDVIHDSRGDARD